MILFKVETSSIKFPVIYVKAESIEDCLYKSRKYFENSGSTFADELHKWITKIEVISKSIIE
jgi:hypothetical protein